MPITANGTTSRGNSILRTRFSRSTTAVTAIEVASAKNVNITMPVSSTAGKWSTPSLRRTNCVKTT